MPESMSAVNHFSGLITTINREEDSGALKTFIPQENKKSNKINTSKAIRFPTLVDKSTITSSFISSDRRGRCVNLKLFMPVSSSIFFRTIAWKRCLWTGFIMLIIFNIVIHFPNRFSHLLSLVKIKGGKNASDTFLTIWICSHSNDTGKRRSKPIRGKRLHQKQAGEPWATTWGHLLVCKLDIKSHKEVQVRTKQISRFLIAQQSTSVAPIQFLQNRLRHVRTSPRAHLEYWFHLPATIGAGAQSISLRSDPSAPLDRFAENRCPRPKE